MASNVTAIGETFDQVWPLIFRQVGLKECGRISQVSKLWKMEIEKDTLLNRRWFAKLYTQEAQEMQFGWWKNSFEMLIQINNTRFLPPAQKVSAKQLVKNACIPLMDLIRKSNTFLPYEIDVAATYSLIEIMHLIRFKEQFLQPLSEPIIEKYSMFTKLIDMRIERYIRENSDWFHEEFTRVINASVIEDFLRHKNANIKRIIDGLFLGDNWAATSEGVFPEAKKQFLKGCGITHILCLASDQYAQFPDDFTYSFIPIRDRISSDISIYIDSTNILIEEVLSSGGGILVHCDAGISRSPSLVIAYLMQKFGWDYTDAFKYTKLRRKRIKPNAAFEQQLRIYGSTLLT